MAFSIIEVVNATELVLGTLCYSLRSPSSSVVGSAPANLPDFMWQGGGSWAPCLGKQLSPLSPHPQGTARF